MKPVLILLIALISVQELDAQTGANDQSGLQDSLTSKKWYHVIRFRLPEFIFDYVLPFRERSFAALPNGMDKYMYPTKKEVGFFAPFTNNYSFRLIGLFYKDRIGLEFYTGGFGAKVDGQPFERFLQAKFPDHYKNGFLNQDYTFSGWQYGLAYKHHWKGLVVEPKFILGFEKMQSTHNKWIFKEIGSNQFTEYEANYWDSSRNNRSYHLQLRLAKRFYTGGLVPWLEFGLKTEYIMAAKRQLYLQVIESSYGKPRIEEGMTLPMRYRSFTIGFFFTVYLEKGHIVN
jgi:hypothetical protein